MIQPDPYSLAPPSAPAPPHADRIAARPIETDRHCPKCGYNLRGLPSKNHRCPECGTPIVNRSFNDELQYGNPGWAARLAFGITSFSVGVLLFPIQLFVLLGTDLPLFVGLLIGGAGAVAEWIGLWQLTAPEPAPQLPERSWSLRRVLRWVVLATVVVDAATRGMWLFNIPHRDILLLPLVFLMVIRVVLLGFYLHTLALRLPDDALANRTIVVTWGLLFCAPTLVFGLICTALTVQRGHAEFATLIVAATPATPFISFYFWGLWLLAQYVKDLRASAAEARKTMLAPPPFP